LAATSQAHPIPGTSQFRWRKLGKKHSSPSRLLGLVRHGLGETTLPGNQYVSWIHEADFIRAVEFLIERQDIAGAVNLAVPHPLPNYEFLRALRQAWGTRIGLPTARWMLEIGTFLLRTDRN
jgi:uncharacterized protein